MSALQLLAVRARPRPQIIWSCRDRRVIYSMRGRSRRMIMMHMIGPTSFIGLIPRHWITIAAVQWQFLAMVVRSGWPSNAVPVAIFYARCHRQPSMRNSSTVRSDVEERVAEERLA